MIKFLMSLIVAAVLGGCSAHVALLTLEKEADNQQQYVDQYDQEMSEMEAKDYE